ncbi:MAG: hypothetical protein Q4D06_01955 [Coriobacteriia bacterium]|nr:hypothetical protein [Coriobacteriia bacterium]
MRYIDVLTPARVRAVSLVLVAAAVVAVLLWIAPVLSGQADPLSAVPAFVWLIVFGLLLLVLNYVETRRQALLRRVWVGLDSLFDGSKSVPYADALDLIEQVLVCYVNSDQIAEPAQAPREQGFVLAIETVAFEYDRNSGLVQDKESHSVIPAPLRVRELLEAGGCVSVVTWTGVVRELSAESRRDRIHTFTTVDELEGILVRLLEKKDSQPGGPALA